MMSGVRRVKAEWFAMKSGGLLCDRTSRKANDRDEGVVRLNTGRGFISHFAGDEFAQREIGEAHSRRRQDQGPRSSHQLPDAEANQINEKVRIRNDARSAAQ